MSAAHAKVLEVEARNYWRASATLKRMERAGVPANSNEVQDVAAEIEAIEMHTNWPRMRFLCGVMLAIIAPVEALAFEIVEEVVEIVEIVAAAL